MFWRIWKSFGYIFFLESICTLKTLQGKCCPFSTLHMPDLKYITETAVQLNHYLVCPSIHQGHLKNKGIIKMKYQKLFQQFYLEWSVMKINGFERYQRKGICYKMTGLDVSCTIVDPSCLQPHTYRCSAQNQRLLHKPY